jgi:hypothetical protein
MLANPRIALRVKNIAERITKLRLRPLAVATAGDPEEKKTVAVHTCYKTGFKPKWCGCIERVSLATAQHLIQTGRAEWVMSHKTVKRDDGTTYATTYIWRRAVVLVGDENQNSATDLPASDVVQLVAEQVEAQRAHEAELEAKQIENNRRKIRRSFADLVWAFRRQLTPEENTRCFDDQDIFRALQIDDTTPFIAQIVGQPIEVTSDLEALEQIAQDARIRAALLKAQVHYWNIILASEGLTTGNGKVLTDAPKGHGLLVTGGYDKDKIEKVGAHREANEDGTHKATTPAPDANDYEAKQDQMGLKGFGDGKELKPESFE